MIYLDCSYIYRKPWLSSGIQSIARSIAREALSLRKDVCLAVADNDGLFYKLTDIPLTNDAPLSHKGAPVSIASGDIYFLLDSAWYKRFLERLAFFKENGLVVGMLIYDTILSSRHETFKTDKDFHAWILEAAKYADFFACVSETAKETLKAKVAALYPNRKIDDGAAFSFSLGEDIYEALASDIPGCKTAKRNGHRAEKRQTWKESAEELLEKMLLAAQAAKKKLLPMLQSRMFDERAAVELRRIANQRKERVI